MEVTATQCIIMIVQMITVIVLIVALVFNCIGIFAQKDSVQASLFNDLSQRISSLVDNEPKQEVDGEGDDRELEHWYVRLYNAFERFAFFANRGYLTPEMEVYYSGFIKGYNKRIVAECPSAVSHLKELEEKAEEEKERPYNELRKLCKTLPF